jgi:hypothetical protein
MEDKSMNKKLFVIIIAIVAVTVITIGVVVFIVISNKNNGSTDNGTNGNQNTVKYEDNSNKKINDMEKVAVLAVNAYAAQDISESATSRRERLSKYFSTDSPVYDYGLDISADNSAVKTSAKVLSIKPSDTSEGTYPSYIANTQITSYSGENKSVTNQSYWVTVKQNPDGSYLAYDAGVWAN